MLFACGMTFSQDLHHNFDIGRILPFQYLQYQQPPETEEEILSKLPPDSYELHPQLKGTQENMIAQGRPYKVVVYYAVGKRSTNMFGRIV